MTLENADLLSERPNLCVRHPSPSLGDALWMTFWFLEQCFMEHTIYYVYNLNR